MYRITVVAIAASTLTSVTFAGCLEPTPIFRPNGFGGCGQIIYGSPSPYTAITKYTGYQGNPYANQSYYTEGSPPYPPYYSYADYTPSYALVITGYDGLRKAKSRSRRHTLEENALSYNEHAIRRITRGVKLARRVFPSLSNVKAFSAKASAPTPSANVTSSGQLRNSASVRETPMPKVVEVAGRRVDIVSADAVNPIDLVPDAPKALSFAALKRAKSEQLDIKRAEAELTNIKRYAASDAAVAGALEQSARDTSPSSLAEVLAVIAGALAAALTARFLGLTPMKIPGFSRKRHSQIERTPVDTVGVNLRQTY